MIRTLITLAALAGTSAIAAAQEVYLVNFTSEYCGVCKVLDPRLDEATADYPADRMQRLVLDFTTPESSQAAFDQVNGTLMANPYADYVGITGIGVLVAADSGETIECLTARMTPEVMVNFIDKAVEVTRTKPIGHRAGNALMCPATNEGIRIE